MSISFFIFLKLYFIQLKSELGKVYLEHEANLNNLIALQEQTETDVRTQGIFLLLFENFSILTKIIFNCGKLVEQITNVCKLEVLNLTTIHKSSMSQLENEFADFKVKIYPFGASLKLIFNFRYNHYQYSSVIQCPTANMKKI